MSQETGVQLYEKVMNLAMQVPGVTVNRTAFLRTELMNYCPNNLDKIIEGNPRDFMPIELLDKIAEGVIQAERWKISAISAATGAASNPFMAAGLTIGDMAAYMAVCLRTSQKLAYLYGFPNLLDENEQMSDNTIAILTPFIGVMFGVRSANAVITTLSKEVAKQVLKRLPRATIGRSAVYVSIKQIAKYVGVRMSKQLLAKGLSKAIPFIGMALSGGLTYYSFGKAAKRLALTLHENTHYLTAENHLDQSIIDTADAIEIE